MSAPREALRHFEATQSHKDGILEIFGAFLNELMMKAGTGIKMDFNYDANYGFKMPDLIIELDNNEHKISLYPSNATFCRVIDSDYVAIDVDGAQKNSEVYDTWHVIKDINNVPLNRNVVIADEFSFYTGKFKKTRDGIIAVSTVCTEDSYYLFKIKNPFAWTEIPMMPNGLKVATPKIYDLIIEQDVSSKLSAAPIETAQKKLTKAEKKKLRKMQKKANKNC